MDIFQKKRVVVGMSGGVDSSVAAYLLKKQGFDVIGIFMKNWNDDDIKCTASEDFADVITVCNHLEIPYYSINFEKQYWDYVFVHFLEEFRRGRTPSPDILCNKEIKFNLFLEHAYSLGADYLATGHYARLQQKSDSVYLLKGKDSNKDQTYFLQQLTPNQLKDVIFPLGNLEKSQVRGIAQEINLPTATKKDSTGICFIGKRNFKDFLRQYIPAQKGNMLTLSGQKMGTHDGLMFYTIGQRHGLKIGGTANSPIKEPWFVVGKNLKENILYVEQGFHHPTLYATSLHGSNANWITQPKAKSFICSAKTRYRTQETEVEVTIIDVNKIDVKFKKPIRAVTPGQAVVFYDGDLCLGGATIDLVYKDKKLLPYI